MDRDKIGKTIKVLGIGLVLVAAVVFVLDVFL